MTITQWLRQAANTLADNIIPSARLDSEIILAHTLNRPRTWLHAHNDESLDPRRQQIADARIRLRVDHTPTAYIIGHKDFYGRRFYVTPSVLIPRPESEALIELLKRFYTPAHQTLIDVGTGSGCLGITAKLEFPDLIVTLSDSSHHALMVTQRNIALHSVEVVISEDDLLPTGANFDIIMANLPYVDKTWQRNRETEYEPALALFADDNGLELIKKLINQAISQLNPNGLLILEADPRQHDDITKYAAAANLDHIATDGYALCYLKHG